MCFQLLVVFYVFYTKDVSQSFYLVVSLKHGGSVQKGGEISILIKKRRAILFTACGELATLAYRVTHVRGNIRKTLLQTKEKRKR